MKLLQIVNANDISLTCVCLLCMAFFVYIIGFVLIRTMGLTWQSCESVVDVLEEFIELVCLSGYEYDIVFFK